MHFRFRARLIGPKSADGALPAWSGELSKKVDPTPGLLTTSIEPPAGGQTAGDDKTKPGAAEVRW